MNLTSLPLGYLASTSFPNLLTSGACTIMVMLKCTLCGGSGEREGFECSACDGVGHNPFLAAPSELFKALAVSAKETEPQPVSVLRLLHQAQPEDSAGIKPVDDESAELLRQAQFLESHMDCCFGCGHLLGLWKHDTKRKWCNFCCWLISDQLLVELSRAQAVR